MDRRSGGWWRTRSDTQPLGPREKEKEDRRGGGDRDRGRNGWKRRKGGKKNGNTCSTIPGLVIQPTHERLEGKIKKREREEEKNTF